MKVKSFLFGLIIMLVVWILVPLFLIRVNNLFSFPVFSYYPLSLIIGLAFFIIGAFLSLHLTVEHIKTGRVTPVAVEPPKKLIVRGFYRYSRNPLYLTILLTFLGGSFIFGHSLLFAYTLLASLGFHLFVVYKEEPELKKIFGQEYIDYMNKAPRWL